MLFVSVVEKQGGRVWVADGFDKVGSCLDGSVGQPQGWDGIRLGKEFDGVAGLFAVGRRDVHAMATTVLHCWANIPSLCAVGSPGIAVGRFLLCNNTCFLVANSVWLKSEFL